MCLIIVKPKGVELPKEEYLRNGASKNSDGTGIAYLKNGEKMIKIKKDFDTFYEFYTFLEENIKKEDCLIIHFRWATHGLKDKGNRHPFPLVKDKEQIRKVIADSKMVMAHNGILSQFSRDTNKKYKDDVFSDSQKFILEILSDNLIKSNIHKSSIQKLIANFLGTDRMVTLDTKGRFWYFGDWEKEDGVNYSNSGYKVSIQRTRASNVSSAYGWGNHYEIYNQQSWIDSDKKKDEAQKAITHTPDTTNMTCENCGNKKKLQMYNFNDIHFILCKKCRRKGSKNKIDFDLLLEAKDDDTNTTEIKDVKFCSSCYEAYDEDELISVVGDNYKVCEVCEHSIKKSLGLV